MFRSLLVGSLLLVSGCARAPSNHYTVRVSPSFSIAEQEQVIAAASAWQTALDDAGLPARLDVMVAEGCGGANCDDVISVYPVPRSYLREYNANVVGITHYYLSMSVEDAASAISDDAEDSNLHQFYLVTLHELGHGMGLVHTGAGTIMCANNLCQSDRITCGDVQQWASLRGMTVSCS